MCPAKLELEKFARERMNKVGQFSSIILKFSEETPYVKDEILICNFEHLY